MDSVTSNVTWRPDIFQPSSCSSFDLARKVDIGMYHSHMSGEGIVPRKCLLLRAQTATNFHLAIVVNGIFVSREVIRARELSVAGLAGRRIDPLTLVRASLIVAVDIGGGAAARRIDGGAGGGGWGRGTWLRGACAMRVSSMFLKLGRGVEPLRATSSHARV